MSVRVNIIYLVMHKQRPRLQKFFRKIQAVIMSGVPTRPAVTFQPLVPVQPQKQVQMEFDLGLSQVAIENAAAAPRPARKRSRAAA